MPVNERFIPFYYSPDWELDVPLAAFGYLNSQNLCDTGGDDGNTVITIEMFNTYAPPWIQTSWQNYKFVKWDSIEFLFEMESQPACYGQIAIWALPWNSAAGASPNANTTSVVSVLGSLATYNPLIFEVNEPLKVTMEVPWMHMTQWADTGQPYYEWSSYADVWGAFPTINVTNITDLVEVFNSTTSVITIRKFFRFKNLQFNCPFFALQDSPPMYDKKTGKWKFDRRVGDNCSAPILPTTINDVSPQPYSWSQAIMARMGYPTAASAAMAGGSMLYSHYSGRSTEAAMAETVRLASEQILESQSEVQSVVQAAAEQNASVGGNTNINPYVPDFQLGAPSASVHTLALGCDLPIHGAEYNDTVFKHSIYDLIKKPYLHSVVRFGNTGGLQGYSFGAFGVLPFSTESTSHLLFYNIGFLQYFKQFFAQWRGSIKFMFKFSGCSFIQARMRLSVGYAMTPRTVDPDSSDWLNSLVPTEDFTINGPCVKTMTIPFIWAWDWAQTVYASSYPSDVVGPVPIIQMTLLNIQTAGNVAAAIPCTIWTSAGDDFQFRFPQFVKGPPASMKGDNCSRIEDDWRSSPFPTPPGMHKGGYSRKPEISPLYVEDLITRWSTYYKNTGVPTGSLSVVPAATRCPIDCGTTPNSVVSVFQAVCQLFMWYTGDIDFQFTSSPRTTYEGVGSYQNYQPGIMATGWGARSNVVDDDFSIDWQYPDNGISFVDMNNWSRQIITVPFVSELAATPTAMFDLEYTRGWLETELNLAATLDQKPFFAAIYHPQTDGGVVTPSSSSIELALCRAGRSFQLMGLLPLPPYRFWPINTTVVEGTFKPVLADVNSMLAAFPMGKSYKKTEFYELHRHILHPDGLDRQRLPNFCKPTVPLARTAQLGKEKDKTK